ncbi:YbaB/EbfC DNA-binding family protein [Nocardia tenerifensis]|uniref:YbaB/EbfC DNA-binding family protein n=1 Tax=Nocardia tenerifensis TaxID=228006 RepID=A0A318KAH6_9NOCA|nr:YbaB/EbfC family nucleoid-associated protein [Nocardia tenerifensis]PXX61702.1 YbaB/EbfC DNA-binding family protein [Nocardia tenerifensis]
MTDFAELEASAAEQLHRMRRLADDIAAIRIEHRTDDGAVTAVVDGSGRLLDLSLTKGISRMSPAEFDGAVVAAAGAAAQRAMAVRGGLVDDFNNQVNNRRAGEQ